MSVIVVLQLGAALFFEGEIVLLLTIHILRMQETKPYIGDYTRQTS